VSLSITQLISSFNKKINQIFNWRRINTKARAVLKMKKTQLLANPDSEKFKKRKNK
jgi:hypothetical protein